MSSNLNNHRQLAAFVATAAMATITLGHARCVGRNGQQSLQRRGLVSTTCCRCTMPRHGGAVSGPCLTCSSASPATVGRTHRSRSARDQPDRRWQDDEDALAPSLPEHNPAPHRDRTLRSGSRGTAQGVRATGTQSRSISRPEYRWAAPHGSRPLAVLSR